MAGLNETPGANRIHIAFFGLRNAGKSTLVNAFAGQEIAIVSDVAGTTTDPVSKAMEILPLGPCLLTDTAGLDDLGELGEKRVEKTLRVLESTDIAVWVRGEAEADESDFHRRFLDLCARRKVVVLEYRRGDSVEELKRRIASVKLDEPVPGLLDGMVGEGDRVLCVVPIDGSAPKGRLILPQQQVIRECLDRHLVCGVCQPEELAAAIELNCRRLAEVGRRLVIVTDSQAFAGIRETLASVSASDRAICSLTSFSILFARQKGDLAAYVDGLRAIASLKDGDTVLVAEGCTHHRQCNDIGAVKIPRALGKMTGRNLRFVFSSGQDFLPSAGSGEAPQIALVVQCGGCMLTRREVLRRIGLVRERGIPIVNYGLLLAAAAGLKVGEVVA